MTRDTSKTTRSVQIEKPLLSENDRLAQINRTFFGERRVSAYNLISSPGSGKTTILERTVRAVHPDKKFCCVIEGDQQTDNDSRRIAATGAPVKQINTGKSCHLNAREVSQAIQCLDIPDGSILFIENVGNLICPTAFDLGESERIVILSVTEGTDKPEKYPNAFQSADCVLINKTDLLPYVDFNLTECRRLISGLNPEARIFEISAQTGDGFEDWLEWLCRVRA
ncbi:hydrogenase nickel incorporation protein HypB [bacterium]|nr:hydrogenase nickel incorporation protein HypB [bacterium]